MPIQPWVIYFIRVTTRMCILIKSVSYTIQPTFAPIDFSTRLIMNGCSSFCAKGLVIQGSSAWLLECSKEGYWKMAWSRQRRRVRRKARFFRRCCRISTCTTCWTYGSAVSSSRRAGVKPITFALPTTLWPVFSTSMTPAGLWSSYRDDWSSLV